MINVLFLVIKKSRPMKAMDINIIITTPPITFTEYSMLEIALRVLFTLFHFIFTKSSDISSFAPILQTVNLRPQE